MVIVPNSDIILLKSPLKLDNYTIMDEEDIQKYAIIKP